MYLLSGALLILTVAAALHIMWRIRWGFPPGNFPSVLAYHKVTSFEFGGTWMPPARFAAQIDALLDAGYRFIDEEAFLGVLEGERGGSAREVLLTFDDGYRELLDGAVPILERRGIPALIFLISDFVGRENEWELRLPGRRFRHLDWDEIRDLAGRGFTFGSHTCTHRDLRRLPTAAVRTELLSSKRAIEGHVAAPVRSLSYPFGLTTPAIAREASRAGYRAAFSMYPPAPNRRIERYNLRREGVYVIDSALSLRIKLGRGGMFWCEDLKGRAINAVAVLTPLLKGFGMFRVDR
ncbi:MAG TPA: polysaccharide deacetylase family protein [Patescibacteria group bacterium]|nr:polysaccharide deacetylase family protein [Patescibacteria group bacterium]